MAASTLTPGGQAVYNGIPFYAAAMTPYNVQASLNGEPIGGSRQTAKLVRKPSTANTASRFTGSILGQFVCRSASISNKTALIEGPGNGAFSF